MKRILLLFILPLLLWINTGCTEQKKNPAKRQNKKELITVQNETENSISIPERLKKPVDFLPDGFVIFDKIEGDLNKDKLDDCVLIIKGTDKSKVVNDEYRGVLDRNRRGIIVLLNKRGNYEVMAKNYDCFSSENEEGGVYFAPELNIVIEKGKLLLHYAHGRYGYWKYMFRYNQNDFELIGYDQSENHGPIVSRFTSCNFLTKKKLVKDNINIYTDQPENEVFKETWETMKTKELLQLSLIKDFDELDFSEW